MERTGKLTINGGFSRLDTTRMMKGAVDNGGFGRATIFLQQDRQLNSGETIWVDGADAPFGEMTVIVITNAGRPVHDIVAVGAGDESLEVAASKAAAKAISSGGKKGAKATSKKPTKKKASTRKSAKKKATAKKSAKKSGKKPAAKKAAKKSTKKKSGK